MKSLYLCLLCALLFSVSASAQQKITASITVTNLTTNGMTFTVNGSTRTFTNTVVNAATQVLTNSDATGNGSKTNLLNQIYSTPFTQANPTDTGSNTFSLVGNANVAMSVTASAGYATISYSTQTVSSVIALQGPVSALPTPGARTNNASYIVAAANAVENTNQFNQNSTATAQLMGTSNSQTIVAIKRFTNAAGQFWGIISNSPAISGTAVLIAGGLYTSPVMANPTFTNGVNYGDAFSSPGAGSLSQQFGLGASASAGNSMAIGSGASSSGISSLAIGLLSSAQNDGAMAIGQGANTYGDHGTGVGGGASVGGDYASAFGWAASATGTNSTAIGASATAAYNNSTAIGTGATTTDTNQVMLGAAGISTVVQNDLIVQGNIKVSGNVTLSGTQTNSTFKGIINFAAESDIAFTRKSISSLANGHNSGIVVGTNVFCELSGASAGFDTAGFANGRDGKMIILLNQNGFAWTNLNESGLEAVPANRIRTLTGADLVLTNAAVTMVYNASVSRWIVISHNP